MPKKLLLPEDLRALSVRRYANQHQNWLADEGSWPWSVSLGVPTEAEVSRDANAVRGWVDAWHSWRGQGDLSWVERQFGRLGKQRFPESVAYTSAAQVATVVGQTGRWSKASERYQRMVSRWAEFDQSVVLRRNFDVLADYSDEDFGRLFALLEWLEANPNSGLYLRQLPVAGLDTKWVGQRKEVVAALLRILRAAPSDIGFHELCGIHKPEHRMRVRLLCPKLRASVGGLSDFESPVEELATLDIQASCAVIVENLETGIALPDLDGCVAVMKLGNAVSALGTLPWLRNIPALYWGDLDTHGFAILDRARAQLPQLKSVLMDEQTLLLHRALWVQEPTQSADVEHPYLTEAERLVYAGLRLNIWGQKVRLEQERLSWSEAVSVIGHALAGS